ncbi:hypothetical protein PG999_007434 [Apiospora kogelbergensis]|uniref:Uncharacterized protein n=1 Tax=Apiospora kogelbergensis TaxID=1337665 RepID=A0AAW0QYD4_9PEZI
MPQFLFVDLPSFRIRDAQGHGVALTYKQLGRVLAQYQHVRAGLRSTEYADLCASLVFAAGATDLWTSYATSSAAAAVSTTSASSSSSRSRGGGSSRSSNPAGTETEADMIHAEENLLLAYRQAFDSPGAYPIVDALLLSAKPCAKCLGYFAPSSASGQSCRLPGTPSFKARFTPRSDRSYTPVFYLEPEDGQWGRIRPSATRRGRSWAACRLASSVDVARGQVYYLMPECGSFWFALNDQETMTDAEVAEAVVRQGVAATYWIGR